MGLNYGHGNLVLLSGQHLKVEIPVAALDKELRVFNPTEMSAPQEGVVSRYTTKRCLQVLVGPLRLVWG